MALFGHLIQKLLSALKPILSSKRQTGKGLNASYKNSILETKKCQK
jgi:hypothetical protein